MELLSLVIEILTVILILVIIFNTETVSSKKQIIHIEKLLRFEDFTITYLDDFRMWEVKYENKYFYSHGGEGEFGLTSNFYKSNLFRSKELAEKELKLAIKYKYLTVAKKLPFFTNKGCNYYYIKENI